MDSSDSSQQLQILLAGYVLGNSTPEEAVHVEQLLKDHPDLMVDLQQLQSTLAVLPLSLPRTQPSPQLGTRILHAAQSDQPIFQPSHSPQKSIWKWVAIGSAATVIGLGLSTYHLQRRLVASQLANQHLQQQLVTTQATLNRVRQNDLRTVHQELFRYQEVVNLLRQPDNRYLALKGTAPEIPSAGSMVIVPTKSSAILVLQRVAALPEGKVYRIWALVNGQKVSCGDFLPNINGDVFVQLPLNEWAETPEVIISIEPEQAIPEPLGEMVISGS